MSGDYDYKAEVGRLVHEARYMDESDYREKRDLLIRQVVWTVESAWNLTDADRPE